MYEIEQATLIKAYKPFDVVTDEAGAVGIIREVSVNSCQVGFEHQISYSVNWIVGRGCKSAWFSHDELKAHTNLLVLIAEMSCHPMGHNAKWVSKLLDSREIEQ